VRIFFPPALALAIASLFVPSSAPAQTAPLLNAQQADALGSDLFQKSSSTGMVMVVVRGQEVFVRGYGETAPGSGHAPNADSLLRLCSLSKIFATDLLMKLAADRIVQLDEPLQHFAPAHVKVPARDGQSIRLVDLATHTAGLPREVGPAPRNSGHFSFPDYAFRWRWLPRQQLKTTPGTAALYSNVGFDFLGDALANAAHESYATLLAQRTTTPLGMKETGFTPNPGQCARLLQGAHDEGQCNDTQNSAGSAGVYSTATDMTAWLKYLLGTGAPALPAQDPAAQAVYIQPDALVSQQGLEHAGKPTGIGLGWMHISGSLDSTTPVEIIEKTGGGAGFVTYIALDQKLHTGIFVAFTDGATSNHFNVFKQTNNVLLAIDGLPPLPVDPPRAPAPTPAPKRPRRRAHS
jgi:D-alanyl-D-alanine-carboxypeptidase/D-alanyl-D-alanine-endopeptidase